MKKILLLLFAFQNIIISQSAEEIVKRANEKMLGKTSQGMIKMTIVRPDWSREITMKSWSKGNDYYLLLVTEPAREKGQVFLKRKNEMWNYIPSINRLVKIPPSMMMQSWMGSDFTNDDLLKESSIVQDYNHKIIGEEEIDSYQCYKIELLPKPEAPVVWGKIISWITKEEFMVVKSEYFDEDQFLVNTQTGSEIKLLGGRLLPAKMTMVPAEKPENSTVLEFLELEFDKQIGEDFFSQQNMKRVR